MKTPQPIQCAVGFLLAWLLLASPANAATEERKLNLSVASGITGGALTSALLLLVFQDQIAPASCRICSTNGLDTGARQHLLWSHPKLAKSISDGFYVAIPAAAITTAFLYGRKEAGSWRGIEDTLLVIEAVSIAGFGSQLTKLLTARQRPFSKYQTGRYPANTDDHLSFWSDHTSFTVVSVTSLAMVSRLRGRSNWPWLLGSGLALALGTGYLRIAADKHWLTDVMAGALWGGTVGVAVPYLHLRSTKGEGINMTATPLGLVGTF
jgi:hypothetical protein